MRHRDLTGPGLQWRIEDPCCHMGELPDRLTKDHLHHARHGGFRDIHLPTRGAIHGADSIGNFVTPEPEVQVSRSDPQMFCHNPQRKLLLLEARPLQCNTGLLLLPLHALAWAAVTESFQGVTTYLYHGQTPVTQLVSHTRSSVCGPGRSRRLNHGCSQSGHSALCADFPAPWRLQQYTWPSRLAGNGRPQPRGHAGRAW